MAWRVVSRLARSWGRGGRARPRPSSRSRRRCAWPPSGHRRPPPGRRRSRGRSPVSAEQARMRQERSTPEALRRVHGPGGEHERSSRFGESGLVVAAGELDLGEVRVAVGLDLLVPPPSSGLEERAGDRLGLHPAAREDVEPAVPCSHLGPPPLVPHVEVHRATRLDVLPCLVPAGQAQRVAAEGPDGRSGCLGGLELLEHANGDVGEGLAATPPRELAGRDGDRGGGHGEAAGGSAPGRGPERPDGVVEEGEHAVLEEAVLGDEQVGLRDLLGQRVEAGRPGPHAPGKGEEPGDPGEDRDHRGRGRRREPLAVALERLPGGVDGLGDLAGLEVGPTEPVPEAGRARDRARGSRARDRWPGGGGGSRRTGIPPRGRPAQPGRRPCGLRPSRRRGPSGRRSGRRPRPGSRSPGPPDGGGRGARRRGAPPRRSPGSGRAGSANRPAGAPPRSRHPRPPSARPPRPGAPSPRRPAAGAGRRRSRGRPPTRAA